MPSCLPINLNTLLYEMESARVEFKASWDEKTTGLQVLHTICAFANDFQNLNGGYIVIGVAEQDSKAVLPPKGLTPDEIEAAQKWIRGKCNIIDPIYQPVLSPEVYDKRDILVIWVPGSDTRPHQAPESLQKGASRKYFIRLGPETIDADKSPLKSQLFQMTARVPFDDRRALNAFIEDIRETKVREFLRDIRSDLIHENDTRALYRNMRIAVAVNGHDAPKHIALLFFSQDPEQWFPGARIEVVHYANDAAGNILEERIFNKRPIQEQLTECLAYLENLSVRQLEKLPYQTTARSWGSYPSLALREALVNAVYHRSYEGEPEPIKIYLYPERMEIISYPGPMSGIELVHLEGETPLPPVPARNRRIGEFLKELRLAEGRGTGIPKLHRVMQQNGSPRPRFDFDEARSYFRVTLPAHPEYMAILTLQDVARLRAVGDQRAVLERLKQAYAQSPAALALAIELQREFLRTEDLPAAIMVYERFVNANPSANAAALITPLAAVYLDLNQRAEAFMWLDRLHNFSALQDTYEAAIQEKRAGRLERAHQYFNLAGESVYRDAKALHEYAQVKIKLAQRAIYPKNKHQPDKNTNKQLLNEAREMLMRIVQMDAPSTRKAWAWYDLGRVLNWLRSPENEVLRAFSEAVKLNPNELRFQDALNRVEQNR
jgi:ATP-dependent DNA helicase RecG